MILGMVKAYPGYLRKLDCGNVVVRADKKEGKVALISSGGSGHEPAHGGFVGRGMLDVAVAGAVFTSTTPDQIYEGIKAIATDAGVLMVVKNYTGDVMNFEILPKYAVLDPELIGANLRRFVANRKDEETACAMMAGCNFTGIAFAWRGSVTYMP